MINWPRSSPGHQFCIFALPFPIQPIFPIVQYQIFSVLGTELNNVCILSPYWQIWGAYAQSEWDKTNHRLPVEGIRGLSFIWRRWFFRLWEVCLKRFLNGFKNTCCAVHGRPGSLDGVHQRAAGGGQPRDLHRPWHPHPTCPGFSSIPPTGT